MNEEIAEVKKPEIDEIDEMLSQYKSSYSVEEQQNEDSATTEITPEETKTVSWQGNPAYYQTGKKAGQIKPAMSHKAPPKESAEISGSLIDGALFIMLIDILLPLLIVVANNKFTKSDITMKDIQLTDKQKKDLSPIADEVVKQINLKTNPMWALFIGMSGIYGINYMAAKTNI